MQNYYKGNEIEVGLDEVARGCLIGRVYTCAVIWNPEFEPDEDNLYLNIKDSKKLSKRKREEIEQFIKDNVLDYHISYLDEKEIDKLNILQATMKSMHNSLNGLSINFDNILVDGKYFKPYMNQEGDFISHQCFEKGDSKFYSIACASILAKVEHDRYIKQLCEEYPELDEKYDLLSNMGYGTKKHIEGIKKYGISLFHRKTFGICKEY